MAITRDSDDDLALGELLVAEGNARRTIIGEIGEPMQDPTGDGDRDRRYPVGLGLADLVRDTVDDQVVLDPRPAAPTAGTGSASPTD